MSRTRYPAGPLVVGRGAPAVLALGLQTVPASGPVGAAASGGQVANTGNVDLPWTLTAPAGLTITPSSGTLAAGQTVPFTLTPSATAAYQVSLWSPAATITGSPVTFTGTAALATAFALTVPATGQTGIAATVSVAPNGPVPAGGAAVTLAASNGGVLGSTTITFAAGATAAQTTTITRSTDGASSVTMTNNAGLANTGSPATFTSSAAGVALAFYELPSVADEQATYDLLGWAWTSGDKAFDFVDIGAVTTTDVHEDSEADELWNWDAQQRRGYSASIVAIIRGRWLTYFKSGAYRADLIADDPNRGDIAASTDADPCCHLYGIGLVMVGMLDNDAACIAEAEALADIGLAALFGGSTAPGSGGKALAASGNDMGYGGGRQMARAGQLVAHLAFATGKSKWIAWLKAMTDAYMTASNWFDSTSGLGIVQGGAYFCDRDWMDNNDQQGPAAYDAGARSNAVYQYGMHAEFLWRAYLITKRADVRDRLIAFARFVQHYGHNPANTSSGGPFCSSYFGIAPGGGYWHRDIPGAAHYDASIINILVWGYKLTGDAALLTRARVHLRQATRWAEGQPEAGGGPLVSATEVADFIDTRRNNTEASVQRFTDNKGQLQYAYQVFESSGQPPTLDSGVPSYIRNLAAGSALAIPNSRVSSAFAGFSGEAGDPIAINAFSGAIWDAKRRRYIKWGGGHNDHNGNGAYGLSIYGSEAPTWSLFKPHTVPPSVSNFGVPSVEQCSNGDPASTHTYNQIVYDAHNDKLVTMGLGSAAGSSGSAFARIRALDLASNAWDAYGAHPSTSLATPGPFACYDPIGRVIWAKFGQLSGPLQRLDVVANTLTTATDGLSLFNIDTAGAIDPMRRYMIAIGGYYDSTPLGPLDNGSADMVLWDLSTYNGTSVTAYARTLSGFPAALRGEKLSLEFHPPSGTFVAWAGGNTLYRLIPPNNPFTGAWTFQTVNPAGTPLPTVGSGSYRGTYSKFRWAPYPNDPSRGVFVMDCVQGTQDAYTASLVSIYKPNF